ncbi:MAG: hypothetical protein HKL90_05500 [Elusimicrobia bacterium]|nr:hypothetical protein [Elusimicrobiota bacterium]
MCGRYTQTASLKELRERFQINVSDILELMLTPFEKCSEIAGRSCP